MTSTRVWLLRGLSHWPLLFLPLSWWLYSFATYHQIEKLMPTKAEVTTAGFESHTVSPSPWKGDEIMLFLQSSTGCQQPAASLPWVASGAAEEVFLGQKPGWRQ